MCGGGGLDAFGLLSVQQHHSAVQSVILGTATPVDHRLPAGRVKLEFRNDQINPVIKLSVLVAPPKVKDGCDQVQDAQALRRDR